MKFIDFLYNGKKSDKLAPNLEHIFSFANVQRISLTSGEP
jgi:hypothetical protein